MNANTENNSTNLSKLEGLFNTKILFLSHLDFFSNVQGAVKTITSQSADDSIALLIKTDHQQMLIKRLWLFLYTSLQFRYLKFKLSKIPTITITSYGVYPHVDNPFAIYQLGTSAEIYTNSNILPADKKNLKGLVSQMLTFITQYHSSTAGIVLLVRKK